MMPVVLILLDAFRSDYLGKDKTPFLYECSQKGLYLQRIIPSAGFCERTEILSGKTPAESSFFTAIGYNPHQNFFFKFRQLFYLLHLIEQKLPKNIKPKLRSILNRLLKPFPTPKCYSIPIHFLPYFTLTEDFYDNESEKGFSGGGIFQLLKENNKTYFMPSFTSLRMRNGWSDSDRLTAALNASISNYDLYLVYLGTLDTIGHLYGPESTKMSSVLRIFDSEIKQFFDSFRNKVKDTTFVFLGDHGMSTVNEPVNVLPLLDLVVKEFNLKPLKDYLYFIDSTLFRFWIFNDRLKADIISKLNALFAPLTSGDIITVQIAQKYGIPIIDRRYGDWIWWAKPGFVLSPDFFHASHPPKGMHGYIPDHCDSHGFCVTVGDQIQPIKIATSPLSSLFPLLQKLLSYQSDIS